VDSVDYTYNAVGFRTEMADSTGLTVYTSDALDRVTNVQFPGNKNVSYTYDDIPGGPAAEYPGQRTKITYPDNKAVNYTYEKDGRMKSVTDWLNKQTVYNYDSAGRLSTTLYPNTTCTAYGYDAAGRLTSVVNRRMASPPTCAPTDATISSYAYTMDGIGNRTQMLVNGSETHTYTYRSYGPRWLTGASGPGYQDTYSYDENGNRLAKSGNPGGYVGYSYDAADQMVAAGGVSYTYDANGNLDMRGADDFTFDHENRLTQAVIAGATSSSTYNGDGLRMSHTVTGVTTNYTWDVAAGLPVVLQDGINSYVYGLDLISATDNAGAQTYFLYDGLGSTTNLTDGNGTTTGTFAYDVFGELRPPSSPANQWLFTGEQRDGDSGLYYLRARYYDPTTGRFISQDPLPTGNLYAYVENNPANLVDPTGLQGVEAGAAVITVSCTGGAAASVGTTCVVAIAVVGVAGVVAVTYATCVVGEACGALGGAALSVGEAAIGSIVTGFEKTGDIAGEIGDFANNLFAGKSKPNKAIIKSLQSVHAELQREICEYSGTRHPWVESRKLREISRLLSQLQNEYRKYCRGFIPLFKE